MHANIFVNSLLHFNKSRH